jgi:two-component system response regulator MtrA
MREGERSLANAMGERGQWGRVLLVDDDPAIRAMYGARLGADGFEVSFAADGRQALVAANDLPAMILLDMRMPGMNGLEVLDRLKRNATTADVPVVMLSNDSDATIMGVCLRTGAADWWSKCALTPAELSRRVRERLSQPRSPA